jgi:hypothetical protein
MLFTKLRIARTKTPGMCFKGQTIKISVFGVDSPLRVVLLRVHHGDTVSDKSFMHKICPSMYGLEPYVFHKQHQPFWQWRDSNTRKLALTALKTVPFNHSGTLPF